MPRSCHPGAGFLVDTCAAFPPEPTFNVLPGEAVMLQVCGPAPFVLPILQVIGSGADVASCPLMVGGAATELSDTNNLTLVSTPGTYTVDTTSIAAGVCVVVEATVVPLSEAPCLPAPAATTTTPPVDPPVTPVPCAMDNITATLVGPGNFTIADLNATGDVVSLAATVTADADVPVVVRGSNGIDKLMNCGDTLGWNDLQNPLTGDYCTITTFEVDLLAGQQLCVVAQAII